MVDSAEGGAPSSPQVTAESHPAVFEKVRKGLDAINRADEPKPPVEEAQTPPPVETPGVEAPDQSQAGVVGEPGKDTPAPEAAADPKPQPFLLRIADPSERTIGPMQRSMRPMPRTHKGLRERRRRFTAIVTLKFRNGHTEGGSPANKRKHRHQPLLNNQPQIHPRPKV